MKRILFFVAVLMLAIGLFGCKNKDNDKTKEGEYWLYYLDKDKLTLVKDSYEVSATKTDEIITELLDKLETPSQKDNYTVFQKKFDVLEVVVDEKVAYIHFSDGYLQMNDIQEVLFRTAVVKTVGQVKGVEYVAFYVREQPLTNDAGNVVGLMSPSDFIDDLVENFDEVQFAKVDLYFSDSTGQKLVVEEKELAFKNNITLEQAVVEKLISGSGMDSMKNTLPKGLKVLGISVKDGICYVNFNSTFLDTIVDVSADVTIYSIVNSLCELPNIKKVQILVEGSSQKTFRDKYPLTTIFERNLDMLPPEK